MGAATAAVHQMSTNPMPQFEPYRKQLKKTGITQVVSMSTNKPYEIGQAVTGFPLQLQPTGAPSNLIQAEASTPTALFKTAGATLHYKPTFILAYSHTADMTVSLLNGDVVLTKLTWAQQQVASKRHYRFRSQFPYRESYAPLLAPRRAFKKLGWCLDLPAILPIAQDDFALHIHALTEDTALQHSQSITLQAGEALIWENALWLHQFNKLSEPLEIYWFTPR